MCDRPQVCVCVVSVGQGMELIPAGWFYMDEPGFCGQVVLMRSVEEEFTH